MSDDAELERRYRRLLAWYPAQFRGEYGQEMLSALMAGVRDRQSHPGLAESANLIANGLRRRLSPRVPPSAPTVRAAVRLMVAGAAVSAGGLLVGSVLLTVDMQAAVGGRVLGRSLAGEEPLVVAASIAFGLALVSLWLWMAWGNARRHRWARILSTVLFVLATLQLPASFTQPVGHAGLAVTALYYGATLPFVAAWLCRALAVWLLWRPTSAAYFATSGST